MLLMADGGRGNFSLVRGLTTGVLGVLIGALICIGIYPEPGEHYEGVFYGFFTAMFHGSLLIPNWVISFFDETRLLKASSSSWWYDMWWWVFAILSVGGYVKRFFKKND